MNHPAPKESFFRKKITFMNVILTFMIVMLHATPNLRFGIPIDGNTPVIYGLRNLAEVAVPLFFFLSGLLFYCNCRSNDIHYKIKRRFVNLVIPYILWNTFFFGIYWVLSHWTFTASRMHMVEVPSNLVYILNGILNSKFTPLWFIKDLIIFTLCAPAIYFLIHTKKLAVGAVVVTMTVGLIFDFSYENPITWCPIYLQGAVIGRYFYNDASRHCSSALTSYLKGCYSQYIAITLLSVCFICLYALILVEPGSITIYRYATPIILWIATDLILGQYLDDSFVIKTWMGYSFFIYCTHYFVLNILQKVAVLNFKPTEFLLTSLMIITPAITILLLIWLASKLSYFKFYKVLTGGRGIRFHAP